MTLLVPTCCRSSPGIVCTHQTVPEVVQGGVRAPEIFLEPNIFVYPNNPPSLGLEGDHLGGGDDPVEAGVGGHLGQTVARVHRGLGGCWVVLVVRPLL